MNKHLCLKNSQIDSEINLPASKSISNRLLILQKINPEISLENLSDADDTQNLIKCLNSSDEYINVGEGGTTLRFYLAYICCINKEQKIYGSPALSNRPIKILTDALINLGAKIDFLEKENHLPIKVHPSKLKGGNLTIDGSVSSQFISALMLVAPLMENDLEIKVTKDVASRGYLKMTIELLKDVGINVEFNEQMSRIKVVKKEPNTINFSIESDWSAASYFFAICALSKSQSLTFQNLTKKSYQPDSKLVELFHYYGVKSSFYSSSLSILKSTNDFKMAMKVNFSYTPDLVQTIAVINSILGIQTTFEGIENLKHKETNRLVALKTELEKLGIECTISNSSFILKGKAKQPSSPIKTYNDHRMAMAFSILATQFDITIENSEVVTKSFPNYWKELEKVGFVIKNTE